MGCPFCKVAKLDDAQETVEDGMNGTSSVDDFQQNLRFLEHVPLFKLLPKNDLPVLARSCTKANFQASEGIIRQGDQGDEFFIIKTGVASVNVKTSPSEPVRKVATLKAGDYFGENALLHDDPRTASIIAEMPLTALKITRFQFQDLGLNKKLQFGQRKAVAAGAARAFVTKQPTPKTQEEADLIKKALQTNENLCSCVSLDDGKLEQIIEISWKESVPEGHKLIEQGDEEADYFYVVQEGEFEIEIKQEPGDSSQSAELVVNKATIFSIQKGGSFGELALLYYAPRAATVKAKVPSVVWVFDRVSFKNILMRSDEKRCKEYVTYLDRVEILAPLKVEEKDAMAKGLVEMFFSKDEMILKQGEKGSTFFILFEGEVSVIIDGVEKARLTATQQAAQIFGERALLNNEPRAASVKVISEAAKTLTMDRESFNMLLGPLEDLKARKGDEPAQKSGIGMPKASAAARNLPRVQFKDLKKLGLLGCGGFGAVELVECVATKETYALKALSKGYVVKTGSQTSVMSEKNIQLMCESDFIVKLFETYNRSQSLYFLLELALGGELYATYNKKGFFGSERHAKFNTAGVVYAFDHLHSKKVIFRDLKPENLLLTEKGHVKLTDMGLAKFVIGKTYTTCGTPDYFAPEIIASTGHTIAVDWWTVGILIFELMSGHPPFESPTPMQTYNKINKGIVRVAFPPRCRGSIEDLVKGLLKREPGARLPMRMGGTENIKEHPWYKSFDWASMYDLSIVPPYVPTVKSKTDGTNFACRPEDMPPQVRYVEDGSRWDTDFATSQ
eukprot:TRINITY_DN6119_c0_g1_i1.p1 TRINITY_DN6119_c0_g1~~TRINITY_DN6119_c0_g1_i1.p1  ORF type:complete len:789 (-),score=167.82 TRINITY_DN6119_c0_g1_i1:151-2517(-)